MRASALCISGAERVDSQASSLPRAGFHTHLIIMERKVEPGVLAEA